MGNICSKSANQPDNFSTPGRTIGATPQNSTATTTPVPKKVTANTPGRTLGGRVEAPSPDDARAAAARAAEERAASASKPGGKLAKQLQDQKKQNSRQLVKEDAEAERRARDADASAEARNYN
ncbi:hypothetical protein LTR84_001506 [Exophiala bonariae]|uniref:Small EDRK-rich factor-like N-terminal domain-containing protein n=1 Tax=Exophiala bonariae TaxID=1690606 RepID=A0AAV9NDZ4_9EURO|nr:hypothetical protein LTR84_001506 [Exophiala bonariae]